MSNQSRKSANSGTSQLILDVRAPSNGAALSAGGGIPFFATIDNTQELAPYAANYSAATGVYTVPAGGHKNVKIKARSQHFSIGAGSTFAYSLQILINNVMRKTSNYKFGTASGEIFAFEADLEIKNLVAGDLVKVNFNGGSGYSSAAYQPDSCGMQILATQ